MRSWKLTQTIPFGWDQERDATVISTIITQFQPTLIGPRVVGDNGFFMGPYFFYLLLPFYLVTSLHPYAIVLFTITYGIIYFWVTYFIIKKLYNRSISLIFLLLWTTLPITIYQDRLPWNPILIPLCFSIILYFLSRFVPSIKYLFSFGLILGLTFHLHFQGLFYILFSLIFIFYKYRQHYKLFYWLIFGFLFTFTPLLIFDLRHQFINFHLFTNFFLAPSHLSRSFVPTLQVWTNFVAQMTGYKQPIFAIIIWLGLLTYGFLNRSQIYIRTSLLVVLITPFIFFLYGERPSEYYFNFLLPIIILFVASWLSKIKVNKYIAIISIIVLSIIGFKSIIINDISLYYKDKIVSIAKDMVQDSAVFVSYDTTIGENHGFNYLVNYYHIKNTNDPSSTNVQFVIPSRVNYPTSGNISFMAPLYE